MAKHKIRPKASSVFVCGQVKKSKSRVEAVVALSSKTSPVRVSDRNLTEIAIHANHVRKKNKPKVKRKEKVKETIGTNKCGANAFGGWVPPAEVGMFRKGSKVFHNVLSDFNVDKSERIKSEADRLANESNVRELNQDIVKRRKLSRARLNLVEESLLTGKPITLKTDGLDLLSKVTWESMGAHDKFKSDQKMVGEYSRLNNQQYKNMVVDNQLSVKVAEQLRKKLGLVDSNRVIRSMLGDKNEGGLSETIKPSFVKDVGNSVPEGRWGYMVWFEAQMQIMAAQEARRNGTYKDPELLSPVELKPLPKGFTEKQLDLYCKVSPKDNSMVTDIYGIHHIV